LRVVFKHALRNTLIPVITQMAFVLPALLSATIPVETVFAYEGIGKAFYRALGGCLSSASLLTQDPPPCPQRGYFSIDYPFALVLLLILVAVVAVSNLLADFLYAVADPRINYASDTKRS
jgi:peptide/nickel transport system permease protein